MRYVNTLCQLGKAARVTIDHMPLCLDVIGMQEASTYADLLIVVQIVEWYAHYKVSGRFKARLRRAAQ